MEKNNCWNFWSDLGHLSVLFSMIQAEVNLTLYSLLGQYNQNMCKVNSPSCIPCPERLPSCLGTPDGPQVYPQRLWTAWYIVCDRNRTIEITKCQHGQIFDPHHRQCVTADKTGTSVVWVFCLSGKLSYKDVYVIFYKTIFFLFTFYLHVHRYWEGEL